MNTKLIERISLTAMLLIVMTVPAMAADCEFYFNTSDGSHEITLAPDDEVVIYLDCHVPANPTGHEIAVVFDPDVVECVSVTENNTMTDWMLWTDRATEQYTNPDTTYRNFDAWHPEGAVPTNGIARCGDMNFKAVGGGVTTLYLALYPEDNINNNHETAIGNDAGNFDWVYGAATFEITVVVPSENFTKSLPAGWNLISLPLTPTDNSTSAVLSNVSQDAVEQYNTATHQFETATTMDPGVGYFVHVTDPSGSTWEYEGTPETSTSSGLESGLNMIGVPNCTMDVGTAMMGSEDYRYVARWNATAQEYEVYNRVAPDVFHGFTTMTAGEGYFVSANSVDGGFSISCSS